MRTSTLKYKKRANIYKTATGNCTFDPTTLDAYSYNWWRFIAKIDGKLVFNNYRYSPTTARHQSSLEVLLSDLGIEIDLKLPLPKGIVSGQSLSDMVLTAEEYLCDKIGEDVLKEQSRNDRSRARRLKKKLESYLDTQANFRDHEIKPRNLFGQYSKMAVHQIVEQASIEKDIENAIYNFHRDGFGSIVFYVEGL